MFLIYYLHSVSNYSAADINGTLKLKYAGKYIILCIIGGISGCRSNGYVVAVSVSPSDDDRITKRCRSCRNSALVHGNDLCRRVLYRGVVLIRPENKRNSVLLFNLGLVLGSFLKHSGVCSVCGDRSDNVGKIVSVNVPT